MPIRLLALDIDGTLTANSENVISAGNRRAIRAAQDAGVTVVIATGRSNLATRPIWEALALSGPSIQYGGAWIVDAPEGTVLDSRSLTPEAVRDVMRLAHDFALSAQVYLGDTVVIERWNPFTERYVNKNGMHVRIDPEIYTRTLADVPKILIFSEDEARVMELLNAKLPGLVHVTRSQSSFVEINDFAATKGQALSRLAARMGILQSDVAAMGDSYLDIDMMQWAGTGVCVENGVTEARNAADVIVPACDKDGVAWFIENHILA